MFFGTEEKLRTKKYVCLESYFQQVYGEVIDIVKEGKEKCVVMEVFNNDKELITTNEHPFLPEFITIKVPKLTVYQNGRFVKPDFFISRRERLENTIDFQWTSDISDYRFFQNIDDGNLYKKISCSKRNGKYIMTVECLETGKKTKIKYGENSKRFIKIDEKTYNELKIKKDPNTIKVDKENLRKIYNDYTEGSVSVESLVDALDSFLEE